MMQPSSSSTDHGAGKLFGMARASHIGALGTVSYVTQRLRANSSARNLQDCRPSVGPRSRLILLEIGSVLSQQAVARGALVSVTATRLQGWRCSRAGRL